MKFDLIVFLWFFIFSVECNLGPPRIEDIQRIRVNAFRVKWSVANEQSFMLTQNKIFLFYGTSSSIEWPSQAIRIDKDGDDAKDLESYIVSSYLDCIKLCLNSPQCRYIVKSGQRCFLKATTPISGPCARNDECAVVLTYSNEATLYDLPLNTTFKLQVQVYDSKSDLWSPPSQLSGLFSTNIVKPEIIDPIEQVNANTIRLRWMIPDEKILNPTRYRIGFYRKSTGDIREWPAQMSSSDVDGPAINYAAISSSSISSIECRNVCLRDPKCSFAVRDFQNCYLKAYPQNPGNCAAGNTCWSLKEYQTYTDLINIPYDDSYKFQVSVYDQYSQTWSATSDFSSDYNITINLIIAAERVDDFNYKILLRQAKNEFPIARMRILVSKNGSSFLYDLKAETNLKRFNTQRSETSFAGDLQTVNIGNFDESKCFQYCNDDFKCLGVKLRNGNCYTTSVFDPFTIDTCLSTEKCYSTINIANETLLQGLDASTNYKIRIEYFTKYNTRGFSNIAEFTTIDFSVNITSTSKLNQYEPAFLKCKALDDTLVADIIWYKDGQIIDKNNRLNITIDDTNNTLQFKNLSRIQHNGRYRCAALLTINNQIVNSTTYDLVVKYGPIFSNRYVNNSRYSYSVGANSDKFICETEGHGPFFFGWKYNNDNGRSLETYSNYSNQTFKYFSQLEIKSIARKDNGSYSCFVESFIISTLYFFVPSAPSKPTIKNLVYLNNTSVYLNWQFDDSGDYPVEKIVIESFNPSGNTETFERNVTITYNFNGTVFDLQLQNDALVRIKLKNAIGLSITSEPFRYSMPVQKQQQGLSNTELAIAIVLPLLLIIILAIVITTYYRKKCGKTTRI